MGLRDLLPDRSMQQQQQPMRSLSPSPVLTPEVRFIEGRGCGGGGGGGGGGGWGWVILLRLCPFVTRM